ncbi:MAG: hypothetical protein JWN76_1128 [Chitinophagaceae bacterium]|nr:hypothetical protein [Chitinophagaceae bacterium]
MQTKLRSYLFLIMLMVVSCKSKNSNEQGAAITTENLVQSYKDLKLPAEISDSALKQRADTTTIPLAAFTGYVPDTVLALFNGSGKAIFHPLGKIQKKLETYLLTTIVEPGKKISLVCFVITKKNKYRTHLLLINGNNRDNYTYTVNITGEPTFVVGRQKGGANNQVFYSKNGFAYNRDANGFINVMSDSNEDGSKSNSVVNPIDTLAHNNHYSGDYVKDENNYLSIRDGRNDKNYIFFIHFIKNNGECTGELKGDIDLATSNKGLYKVGGDPCIIDFNFGGNSVSVKEQGSCGNHRGIKCYFDDTYQKKKQLKPVKK